MLAQLEMWPGLQPTTPSRRPAVVPAAKPPRRRRPKQLGLFEPPPPPRLTYMEQWLLKTIDQLYRDGGKTPVKTIILAGMLDKDDGQIRGVLRRMEAAKLIVRKGQRMGWMPARAVIQQERSSG